MPKSCLITKGCRRKTKQTVKINNGLPKITKVEPFSMLYGLGDAEELFKDELDVPLIEELEFDPTINKDTLTRGETIGDALKVYRAYKQKGHLSEDEKQQLKDVSFILRRLIRRRNNSTRYRSEFFHNEGEKLDAYPLFHTYLANPYNDISGNPYNEMGGILNRGGEVEEENSVDPVTYPFHHSRIKTGKYYSRKAKQRLINKIPEGEYFLPEAPPPPPPPVQVCVGASCLPRWWGGKTRRKARRSRSRRRR